MYEQLGFSEARAWVAQRVLAIAGGCEQLGATPNDTWAVNFDAPVCHKAYEKWATKTGARSTQSIGAKIVRTKQVRRTGCESRK